MRLPADPATKSARSLKRVFLNLDELPQEDKLGSIADALVSEVAPEDARRMVGQMEQLTEALKVRVNNLK